jgi:hypothetical protein
MEEPPTVFSSPMKPSILWPKNGAAQSILKSPSTDPPRKAAASITPLLSKHQKLLVEFTAVELSAFVFVCADLFL